LSYLGELRENARPLAAATIGSASGLLVAAYTTTVFAPYLVSQFHWPKAQFSLVGLAIFVTVPVMPLIGRLTDRFGVRPVALAGALLLPLAFLGYSFQTGSFAMFWLLCAAVLVTGSTTTPAVWCRLVAENFQRARGLALFIVTGVPALVGAILPRLLVALNDAWGWRWGYRAMAVYFLVGGLIAVMLAPRHERGLDDEPAPIAARSGRRGAWREIVRSRTFWIITGAMMLCQLATQLHAAQMMLMLEGAGLGRIDAANAVSAFAIGAIIGRGVCGLSLDRFSPPRVAFASMVLPALGYALIAANPGAVTLLTFATLLIGLAYGSEGDLPSFLVARHFPVERFSSAMSLVYCGVLFSSASGALILAIVLRQFGSFTPFLWLMSGSVLAGSLLFLLLPGRPRALGADMPLSQPAV
jgi:MFS family permease